MALQTTLGQLLVNESLPEDMRDHNRILDKKATTKLFDEIAQKYPQHYRDIAKKLFDVGREASYSSGGQSFGLRHIRSSPAANQLKVQLQSELNKITSNRNLSDVTDPATGHSPREVKVIDTIGKYSKPIEDAVYKEGLDNNNPLAEQVKSGSRGNPANLRSLTGGDLLYVDHKDRPIAVPILNSYSKGLSPTEYYAGSFGARKGLISNKFATQEAGAYSKQLNNVSHKLVVTHHDDDSSHDKTHPRGLPVDTKDSDNVGALLASDFGPFKRNTILSERTLNQLHDMGHERILIRSPITGMAPDGGLYSEDVGVREKGFLAPIGDMVGISATQALTEPLSQGMLSAKHSGGIAGVAAGGAVGFPLINQLSQVPKTFPGGATHAEVDGKVAAIKPNPAGGLQVEIGNKQHFIPASRQPSIKVGDTVEAGDIISSGLPNPAKLVKYKGIGEGSRQFVHLYGKAYKDSGIDYHRRNVELLARGLINHVRLNDEVDLGERGSFNPNDVVPYSLIEQNWKPRPGWVVAKPNTALGKYLEKPVLHYSIGTQIKPSVVKELQHFGIQNIMAHPEPPPFEPEMVRAASNLEKEPDWMTRMLGTNLERSTLKGVHKADFADEAGISFVPSLAKGISFGRQGLIQDWHKAMAES